jgi:hypothetical protein
MRRGVVGTALGVTALGLLAACGSASSNTFHPSGTDSAAPSTGAAATTPWPGKARWQYDPLPADPQQAMFVHLDRAFHLAFYDAIYTNGADQRWTSYISDPGVVKNMRQELKQDIAAHRGYQGVEKLSHTAVRTNRDISGFVVDSCVDDSQFQPTDVRSGQVVARDPSVDGPVREEQQDVFTEVNGAWKINTLDTFTDTEGYALVEPKEC